MTPTVAALLAAATRRLPAHEARELLAFALGVQTHPATWAAPDAAQTAQFWELVDIRLQGVPLQYLTGVAPFRTVELAVGPGVFIPRPETEVVTGWAIDQLRTMTSDTVVVELCAGSGAISLAIATEVPGLSQYAVERDLAAAEYARRNLVGTSVTLIVGDMAVALGELNGSVDLVIANPPYIAGSDEGLISDEVRNYEPADALFSGTDGLAAISVVTSVAARLLRPGGWLVCEHGDEQGESAPAVIRAAAAFGEVVDHLDLTGRPRFVTARRGSELAR